MDTTKRIATTLTHAIQKIRKYNQAFQGSPGEAIQKLAKIFGTTADKVTPTQTNTTQTPSTPTASTQMRSASRTHQHVIRESTTGIIPVEPTPPADIPLTQPSEGVTIPTSEGECTSTHSTLPHRQSKRLRTISKKTINNPTQLERHPPPSQCRTSSLRKQWTR